MLDLKKPDWVCNLTTGIIGVCFHLVKDYDLAVISGQSSFSVPPKDGKITFWILKNKHRDVEAESYLLSNQQKFGKIHTESFGSEKWLTIAERDLKDLYQFSKRMFRKAKVA